MGGRSTGRTWFLIPLGCFLLFSMGNDLVGHWDPAAKIRMGDRIGADSSHPDEKLTTGLLCDAIGIAGIVLVIRRRSVAGIGLVGTSCLLQGVRREVFYVCEGGLPFDRHHLGPWIFLMLSWPMFWLAYREHRAREDARAVLEEVDTSDRRSP